MLLQGVHVPFLRSRHSRTNEQARLHLVLVEAYPVAQRVAVVDIQVGHYVAGLFAPKDNAEHRRFFELFAVLKALEQGANVVIHKTVFRPKTVNLFQDKTVREAQIALEGLFMNADSGFDARALRKACFRRDIEANIAHDPRAVPSEAAAGHCFDAERCRQRTAIECTNAWLDSFKTLLVRYETNVENWIVFHFLAFTGLLPRKIPPDEKPQIGLWSGNGHFSSAYCGRARKRGNPRVKNRSLPPLLCTKVTSPMLVAMPCALPEYWRLATLMKWL